MLSSCHLSEFSSGFSSVISRVFVFVCLLVALGLHRCSGFSLVAASRSYSLVSVRGLLIAAASPVAEHKP